MNFSAGRMSIESITGRRPPSSGCWIKLHDSADLIRNEDRVRIKAMRRKQDGLVPIGEVFGGLGPVKKALQPTPQALHHFTVADQVDQLVTASETTPDLGFMARLLALCSLPRTNPGTRLRYVRRNGPYKLGMTAGIDSKLPFGNFPRLILAWVCTEAVRTGSRDIVLGRSLSDFMRSLGLEPVGGVRTRLRNQMRRLFSAHVQLVYEDEHGEARVSSSVADRTEFWWNERKPDHPVLWESKIRLGEDFYNEIISHPVPLNMNTLTALKRCSLGLDLYMWLAYRHLSASCFATDHLASGVPSVWLVPGQGQRQVHRPQLPHKGAPRVEEDQARLAGTELLDGSGPSDPASLDPGHPSAQSRPARKLISHFPASQRPVSGLSASGWTAGTPPARELARIRKSPLSTGLCESGGFSSTKPDHPQRMNLYQTGSPRPESLYQTGSLLQVIKNK